MVSHTFRRRRGRRRSLVSCQPPRWTTTVPPAGLSSAAGRSGRPSTRQPRPSTPRSARSSARDLARCPPPPPPSRRSICGRGGSASWPVSARWTGTLTAAARWRRRSASRRRRTSARSVGSGFASAAGSRRTTTRRTDCRSGLRRSSSCRRRSETLTRRRRLRCRRDDDAPGTTRPPRGRRRRRGVSVTTANDSQTSTLTTSIHRRPAPGKAALNACTRQFHIAPTRLDKTVLSRRVGMGGANCTIGNQIRPKIIINDTIIFFLKMQSAFR